MQQLERRSDRWISAALSIVLHGALIAVLVYGWWSFRKESRPPPTLAIDATVVSSKALNGSGAVAAKPTPRPQPPKAPPPVPAPPQTAADDQTVPPPPDMAAREVAAKKQAEQAQADAERKVQERAQRKKQEEAQRQAQQQAEAAEEAKKVAEAKQRALAAKQQRLAEAKLEAEEQRRADEAKALALNPADLQQSVAAEEKAMSAQSGPAMASWVQLITARIEHAWIRPPTAREGLDCVLDVTQVPGGQIVSVKVGACNGDAAVIQSIQDAVYRASPLPPPPDPALFERDLQLTFKPTD